EGRSQEHDMKVRKAAPADAEQCAEISPMRPAGELENLLTHPNVKWVVLENDEGVVIGTGIIHLWPWNKMAWVWDLTIEKKERGKGKGAILLEGMIAAAREMGARVLMDVELPRQTSLVRLYLENGFRVCGTNDRWFACDKDATAVFYGYDL
ncbi:GNAT family N-acetyltransferase, partial [Candidatus Hydrogenedentota bacterium]